MLIIFLSDLPGVHVVLSSSKNQHHFSNREMHGETHLDDLLIRHARQENVLLVVIWMEPNDVGNLPITEPLDTLSGLSIPKFHLSIISA